MCKKSINCYAFINVIIMFNIIKPSALMSIKRRFNTNTSENKYGVRLHLKNNIQYCIKTSDEE